MAIGKRVVFHGRVQGVGFRYTTRQLAENYAVGGFVRNLPDGTVELVAEGEASDVDAFIAAVASRMARHVDRQSVSEHPVLGLHEFEVRH